MTTFVWKDGAFRDKRTDEVMAIPERIEICMPRIQSDIPEYRSPVGDHKLISSRSARREDLKRHDCVEVPPRDKPRELKNPNFARKWGLEHRLAEGARA